METRRQLPWVDFLWLLVFGVASSWWCLTAGHALSATWDEPVYLRHGLEHWHTWAAKPLMRLGTMPLAIDVQTLPLFLWEKWHGLTIDPVRDIAWALPCDARRHAGFLVGAAYLCLASRARAGRSMGGPSGGGDHRLRAAFSRARQSGDFRHRGDGVPVDFLFRIPRAPRLGAGSGGSRCLRCSTASRCWPKPPPSSSAFSVCWRSNSNAWSRPAHCAIGAGIFGLSPATCGRSSQAASRITFLYCGSDWAPETSFVKWAQTLAPGRLHDAMLWTSEHLRIFSNAGEGLVQQIKHNIRGHGAFLLGQEYRRAIWYYFPVALTIKTSLPLAAFAGRAGGRAATCTLELGLPDRARSAPLQSQQPGANRRAFHVAVAHLSGDRNRGRVCAITQFVRRALAENSDRAPERGFAQ